MPALIEAARTSPADPSFGNAVSEIGPGALPAVFAMLPVAGHARILGVGVPWLVLGVLMYPFLIGVAWRYVRVAERVEQNFADHVQD